MKIVSINATEILFDNGKKLTSEHDQDCCELVFADFENMQVMGVREKNYVNADELDFFENILDSIVPIEDLGFYLVTKQGICLLVSCYDVQNGYYSDRLTLRYGNNCKDISKYTKHEYDSGVNYNGEYLEEITSKSNKTQGIVFRKYEEGWATWSRDEREE